MELLDLYFTFLKLGLFNFGGGYALLPMVQREIVNKKGWATDDEVVDYFAVGQCTPGVISINVSTFIGYKKKGIIGAIVAGLGFVTPAFFIILLIATLLTNFSDNAYVSHALGGIRIMVFFLVLSAIVKLCKKSLTDIFAIILGVLVGIMAIFVGAIPLYVYIIFAAIYGITVSIIREKRRLKKENKEPVQEEAIEANEEEPAIPVEKSDSKKKSALCFILGMLVGLCTSLVGLITFTFIKNKSYRKGLSATAPFTAVMLVCALVSIFKHDILFFKLYFQFFKVGLLAFGGGLATIPFLSEMGTRTGWFSQTDLANMIAVSESTPGAMGINMSTYVGYTAVSNNYGNIFLSFLGGTISTLGIITPAILVIILVSIFLAKFKNNKIVNFAFYGLRAASVGLIIAAAYSILKISIFNVAYDLNGNMIDMLKEACKSFKGVNVKTFCSHVATFFDTLINWRALGVGVVFGFLVFKFKKHPIMYICIAAVVGILLQM